MTSEEPTFRRATVEDAPAMAEVMEIAFGRWPAFDIPVTAVEHLQWKMQPPGGIPANHTQTRPVTVGPGLPTALGRIAPGPP